MDRKTTPSDLVMIEQLPEMEPRNLSTYFTLGFVLPKNSTSAFKLNDINDFFGILHLFDAKSNLHLIGGLSISVFGVTISALLLKVLMMKKMRNQFNYLLIAMAYVNIFTMLAYATCVLLGKAASDTNSTNLYVCNLIVSCFTTTLHTSSTWIAVLLFILRLLYVRARTEKRERKSWNTLIWTSLVFVTILSLVCVAPLYGLSQVHTNLQENTTMHILAGPLLGSTHEITLLSMYAVFGKILPCVITVVVGGYLMYFMAIKTKSRIRVNGKRDRHMKISTILLLTIVLLFVISELPPGIMILLPACSVDVTSFHLYTEDVQDCIALLVGTVNLALSCAMSQGFRVQCRATYFSARRFREVRTTRVWLKIDWILPVHSVVQYISKMIVMVVINVYSQSRRSLYHINKSAFVCFLSYIIIIYWCKYKK